MAFHWNNCISLGCIHLGFSILTFDYFVIYLSFFHCLYFVQFWFITLNCIGYVWIVLYCKKKIERKVCSINSLHPSSLLICIVRTCCWGLVVSGDQCGWKNYETKWITTTFFSFWKLIPFIKAVKTGHMSNMSKLHIYISFRKSNFP